MGIRIFVIAFPIVFLAVAALFMGSTLSGTSTVSINSLPSGTPTANCVVTITAVCFPGASVLPANTAITCSNQPGFTGVSYCPLLVGCGSPAYLAAKQMAQGLWCGCDIYQNCDLYLQTGQAVLTGSAAPLITPLAQTQQTGVYNINTDWTIILVGLVALACVSAVSVFAIGLNSEAAHIIFIIGGLTAIWTILTLASGFGQSASMFGQLDALQINGTSALLGTGMYTILSLIYFIAALAGISRGA